jgi:hypothetical protein
MKLAQGLNMTLAMIMGTVKRKVLRPSTICLGVSLIVRAVVNSKRNNVLASCPELCRLMRYIIKIPIIVAVVAWDSAIISSLGPWIAMNTTAVIRPTVTIITIPSSRMFNNFRRRASSGSDDDTSSHLFTIFMGVVLLALTS